jgi:hypothetical protein
MPRHHLYHLQLAVRLRKTERISSGVCLGRDLAEAGLILGMKSSTFAGVPFTRWELDTTAQIWAPIQ